MTIETIMTICMGVIALITLLMNGRSGTRQDAERTAAANARIESKLSSIDDGVMDIRAEMRTMRNTVTDHGQRLSKCESDIENTKKHVADLDHMFHKAHPPQ